MRIPNNLTDEFSIHLNKAYGSISQLYLEGIKRHVQYQKVKVMLADASVTEQDTFDPRKVAMFYEMISRSVKYWSSEGIVKTDTDDLRRLHILFNTSIANYNLSCYFGMQYHALPFYKFDKRIKNIQVEIMELDEKTATMKEEMARRENTVLEEELKKRGIVNLAFEDMLATMYNDEKLYSELIGKIEIIENSSPEYVRMQKRKEELVRELNDMVMELYRTTPVLINYNNLMQGEEGAAIYFDLEITKRGEKSGTVDIGKIPDEIEQSIIDRMKEMKEAMETANVK